MLAWFQAASARADARPNLLWLTSEDHGPQMGCYGDQYASTPNVDRLAAKGMIYTHAWSNAPVCAPARTTIISGLYPPSTGAEAMRSLVAYPNGKAMFPHYLRQAGYYCTNQSKTDYNLKEPGSTWDVSSARAHWKNRQGNQPFFAVFNSTKSHESQIRTRPHTPIHDPAKVRVPAYHPDTPEVRRDWAQYYDQVSAADADAGARLKELDDAGLAEETIVFYYGDHGSGMPRSKRWPFNSGLHVPLVVYIPEKFKALRPPEYQAGGKSDRLVSFVDLAPTVLSLAGIEPPSWMQGHAFLGQYQAPAQPFVYGFRGRMDERYDLVRSSTDGRYVYIRNYMPHKIYGQYLDYMFQTPTTQVWKRLHDEGRLTPAQDAFWKTKPAEELYDLQADPDEIQNLAAAPGQQAILATLRQAHRAWETKICDVGFLPEGEIQSRSRGSSPYDMGHDEAKYPFRRVFETAELASMLAPSAMPGLKTALTDSDSAVRYWAALGFLMRGGEGVRTGHEELARALDDPSPYVRIVAAEALGRYGDGIDLGRSLSVLASLGDGSKNGFFVTMSALNGIGALGDKAAPLRETIRQFPPNGPSPHSRYDSYVPRLLEELQEKNK
ncbi:sulfatase-like hydrolase/transferase [Singulisphaera sp. GP187]|uniref:sulfatase-like hydrolase/transferase n=1 Tax=Singulisphaera sp. GP187 TaxID=1882752 RepID=UPI0009409547|nr:sulfatase-like hydrolase/transferase [Singulisphaera sp. GP187]